MFGYDSTDENKDLLNVMMFGMELKRKSKMQTIVNLIMKKIT